jgi:hypothetical protein
VQGLDRQFLDELMASGMRTNYSQDCTKLNALATLVSMAGWWNELKYLIFIASFIYFLVTWLKLSLIWTNKICCTGVQSNSLWQVVGGNEQVPAKLLERSGATVHKTPVTKITRLVNSGV